MFCRKKLIIKKSIDYETLQKLSHEPEDTIFANYNEDSS
jgi:hypothetical protein